MARTRQHVGLNVCLNSHRVGRLQKQPNAGVEFRYDESWLDSSSALPISLGLPLQSRSYSGDPVFAVLDNLLPDGRELRRQIAERIGAQGSDPYSLLMALGRDCVGALQFLRDDEESDVAETISSHAVTDAEVERILNELRFAPLGVRRDDDFRVSLAGAQEKTALLRLDGRWHRPSGATPTTHILKPEIGRGGPHELALSSSVENEFFCLTLTAALGLPSASVTMEHFGSKQVLVVERFDREWRDSHILRRPQEDFCQALSLPSALKYQSEGGPGIPQIIEVLKSSDDPDGDIAMFLRAVIVFWLLAAIDGHAKNFSIFLSPGGRYRLTPLYDVISVQPALDAGHLQPKQVKMAMSVGDNRHYTINTIFPRHFVQTAAKAGIGAPIVRAIFDDLLATAPASLDRALASLPSGFPEQLASSIVNGFKERLQRLEQSALQK